jgi:DNA-binding NtrC family response regulator
MMERPMRPQPLIFIVSPKPGVLTAMEQLLEATGYKAAGCLLAADPYAMIVKFWPDLLIIDVSDQDPRAPALLKKLDRDPATRDVPIIATSTHADSLARFAARPMIRTSAEILLKPYDLDPLVALVTAVVPVRS